MSAVFTDVDDNYLESRLVELHPLERKRFDRASWADYFPLLYGVIIQKLGQGIMAEEALGKTVDLIRAQSSTYQGTSGVVVWMLSILREALRSHPTLPLNEKFLQSPATLLASGGNLAQRPELIGMSRDENNFIYMLFYQNQTQVEIASELKLSLKLVRIKTREGLLKFRT